VADQAAEKLRARFPGLQVVGTHDGYFQEEEAVVAEINRVHPDVLFVCLGAGKQERFMYDHRGDLQVGFMAGLGGSLDGFAGIAKRAPRWMIRCNLEWLYRLIREPWRIGRMMRLPKFLGKVIWRRMKG
jgi:N-acetylglucosaminyldiphosphoundecaprenol N-acetyl-beta-D-mannosaminyltransferase